MKLPQRIFRCEATARCARVGACSARAGADSYGFAHKVLRSLLAKITRERIITAALACISIGALFLFWYLGTKYRLEFYIRFKNVPTPYEVYQQLTQVGLSNKYLSILPSASGASCSASSSPWRSVFRWGSRSASTSA